jgi:hypothetical protein
MTDQQPQGDFAAGERAGPQALARDFAEGEERLPMRPPGNAPQRPVPTRPTEREPS